MQGRLPRGAQAVVEGPVEAVGVVLDVDVAAAEAIGHACLRVHAEVAIGVAHEPDVGWLGHEYAVREHFHAAGQHEAVGKDRAAIHAAVTVGVLQHDDAAHGIVLACWP